MSDDFKNGVIEIDGSPTFVFYSGQIVTGSIIFKLDQPITFSVIFLQVLGEATVSWTENQEETIHGVKRVKVIKYEGREEYFNYTFNLAGGGTGTSSLPRGRQSIPFKFQIPFISPSSFKGDKGQVAYTMSAHLVVPEHVHAHEVITRPFQVVAPFDLNIGSQRIKEPINLEFEEVYGCCMSCSSPNPVTIRAQMPISGYCPGQTIPVSVSVDNESTVEITKILFEFLSRELYRSQRPVSEYIQPETVLMATKKGPVMGKSKRTFTCNLVVPDILPPFLENCGIIDVGYFIRITIKLSGCNEELQDEAEICLGMIPVREFTQGEYVHPLANSLPSVPIPDPTTTEILLPPVSPGFRASNTSLNRAQYVQPQASQYPNNPPPYPYPGSMEMKVKPNQEIGFKASDNGPGYPTNAPGYPTGGPGYPTSGPGYPTGGPGYPTSGPGYPTGGPGYPTTGPSFPPSGPTFPTGGPGYPTNASTGMNPPPYSSANNGTQGGYQPSAPPPST